MKIIVILRVLVLSAVFTKTVIIKVHIARYFHFHLAYFIRKGNLVFQKSIMTAFIDKDILVIINLKRGIFVLLLASITIMS